MTKEDYEAECAEQIHIPRTEWDRLGLRVIPCDCGGMSSCSGWMLECKKVMARD